jgi:hypothetical protein
MMRNIFRQADTMIAVESRPAIVDFADILAATEIVDDDIPGAPWSEWDGWEHTALSALAFDHAEDMQGYAGRKVVQVHDDWGVYDHARRNGASKQVAAELSAASRRQTLRQLVEWYTNGWAWYGVTCRFTVLGDTYRDSLWGIDDIGYAETCRVEIAEQVAYQLEQKGYTVTGRQVPKQQRYSRVNSQNWSN